MMADSLRFSLCCVAGNLGLAVVDQDFKLSVYRPRLASASPFVDECLSDSLTHSHHCCITCCAENTYLEYRMPGKANGFVVGHHTRCDWIDAISNDAEHANVHNDVPDVHPLTHTDKVFSPCLLMQFGHFDENDANHRLSVQRAGVLLGC